MLLDTSHRDINEKSHNKSRKGSKFFKNKHRNNYIIQDINRCQVIDDNKNWK